MSFNVVDTYFVAKIGTVQLAAISFTFPIVLIVNSLSLGIGIGVMALFSKAFGKGDRNQECKLATASLLLGLLLTVIITIFGLLTIEPVFKLLGATDEVLPYIKEYMLIWYLGSVFMVVPMIGDHILRGLGDMKTPSYVMLTSSITNIILDPILIFGIGFIPAMGIKGAAIATVFSRMITTVVSLYVQIWREDLIMFRGTSLKILVAEFKSILFIGMPNALIRMIPPVATAFFTAILARFGIETVAGYGVAARIEMFFLVIIIAMSVTASVFIGQNLGAGKIERVNQGLSIMRKFSIIYGVVAFLILAPFGGFLGSLFDSNPEVFKVVAEYMLIVPLGFGMLSFIQIGISVLNVAHKPLHAGLLSLLHLFVINLPLAFLLSGYLGAKGVFISICISICISGIIAYFITDKTIKKEIVDIAERDFSSITCIEDYEG